MKITKIKEDITPEIANSLKESIAIDTEATGLQIPERDKLTLIQKTYRKAPGLVAEGRDMSSKLFPDSLVKIFLTANLEERVMRRANQLRNAGQNVNISELKNEIVLRDDRDTKRTQSPLKQTEDSIFIDSSEKTVGEITNLIKKLIDEKY